MKNVQFSINSIEARKIAPAQGQVTINNNSTLTSVNEVKGGLGVAFMFTSRYEPNIGFIKIEGDLKVPEKPKDAKRAMEEWVKSDRKKLPDDVAERVHNAILHNCIIEATILSRDVRLPSPIPAPHVKVGKMAQDVDTSYIR